MNNITDIANHVVEETKSVDYQYFALEAISDIFCVLMAIFLIGQGIRKLLPFHSGYSASKKGFFFLANRWGVAEYPHLFRTIVGILEVLVFIGCMMCFLPQPGVQAIVCMALITGIALCVPFLITRWSDPWKERLPMMQQMAQGGTALAIRLYQDVPTESLQSIEVFAVFTIIGLAFMIYRRARYGRIPNPLLG